jgi:redox-sensitive bicupin YhaK (pirin superfamily)
MTDRDHDEPSSKVCPETPTIETILHGKTRDIDGLPVSRVLPAMARRLVGPFCFFDHLGPTELAPGKAIDVRPHPHIGLSTVSYVLEGEVMHKDSLGSVQRIGPGAINWMTSGRGIVHSERTPEDMRGRGAKLHMIQLWVALPRAHEETDPGFWHHPEPTLPEVRIGDAQVRVLAGSAYGATSPVQALSSLFYCEVFLPAGASLALPDEHAERAAYLLEGEVSCGAETIEPRHMVVFLRGTSPVLHAIRATRLLLLGGEPHPEPRFMEWNFVSSSKERIEQAKADWRERRFPAVPGDDVEFIPLP